MSADTLARTGFYTTKTRKRHSRYPKAATFFRSIPRQRRGSSDSCLKLIPLRGRAAATLQHDTYLVSAMGQMRVGGLSAPSPLFPGVTPENMAQARSYYQRAIA